MTIYEPGEPDMASIATAAAELMAGHGAWRHVSSPGCG